MALFQKASSLSELGQDEEALIWFNRALEIEPNDIKALNNKGVLLSNLGKNEEAIALYDKALDIDPNANLLLIGKGIALFNLQKYDEAIIWYDKALDIDPNNVITLNNKAAALVKQFEKLNFDNNVPVSFDNTSTDKKDINHDNYYNYYSTATFNKNNNNNYPYSIRQLSVNIDYQQNNILKNDERYKIITTATVQSSTDTSSLEQAIELYDQALEINPDNEFVIINKGRTLGILEKYDQALNLFDKILDKDQNNIDAMCNKVKVLQKAERLSEANYLKEKMTDLDSAHTCDLIDIPSIIEDQAF